MVKTKIATCKPILSQKSDLYESQWVKGGGGVISQKTSETYFLFSLKKNHHFSYDW